MSLENKRLAFIGSGVMGEAMMKGLLHQELIDPRRVIASDPHEDRLNQLAERYGIQVTLENTEAAEGADILVLSVKPQVMEKVLDGLHNRIEDEALIVSIAAGVKLKTITEGCNNHNVVRSMPNTPGQIGRGMTVWTATPEVTEEQRQLAAIVLGAMGETLYVNDEKYMDMATALNGSGPSYVFLLMEAMIDAGVHMGFSRQEAQHLVQQTMLGSVEYAIASGKHPAELRNQVTSPGGTSAAALYQLEKGGIRTVLTDAIWAAYRRSVELGKESKD
ncbi:MAG: pyrroline-5-carboxylate reductase [Anaerolineae bacterium]